MARIAVFGASGRTGREVLRYAVEKGHQVVAVTRDPTRLPTKDGLEVRQGDVLDGVSLAGLLTGVDVVISALGPADGRRPTTVYSAGMRAIRAEMNRAGVVRIVAVSAVPVSAADEKTWFERLVLHPILWRFFGQSYRDLRVMESELAETPEIGWAVVRPPRLTDEPGEQPVRSAWDEPLRRTTSISRQALARTLVDVAVAEPFRRGTLTVTRAS